MWWIIGLILAAIIMFTLCVGSGKADRQLRYICVRDLELHNDNKNN